MRDRAARCRIALQRWAVIYRRAAPASSQAAGAAMLNALYNEKILNFAAHIGQTERLTAPDATVTHHSPLCGSRITVDVSLGPDGRIAGYGQQVREIRSASGGERVRQ